MEPVIEWRDVENYDGAYSVSNTGLVRSNARAIPVNRARYTTRPVKERVLSPSSTKEGYRLVSLTLNKEQKSFLVHRLVATAFIPNPDNKPQINHIDNDPSNNVVNNLEWCTPKENSAHSINQGRRVDLQPRFIREIKLDQVYTLLDEGVPYTEIARRLRMDRRTVKKYSLYR